MNDEYTVWYNMLSKKSLYLVHHFCQHLRRRNVESSYWLTMTYFYVGGFVAYGQSVKNVYRIIVQPHYVCLTEVVWL